MTRRESPPTAKLSSPVAALADAIGRAGATAGPDSRPTSGAVLRYGLVTAIGAATGPTFGKAQTDATGAAWLACDANYTPTVGDLVYLLSQGPVAHIGGRIGVPPPPTPPPAPATTTRAYMAADRTAAGSIADGTWTNFGSWVASASVGITVSGPTFTVPTTGHYSVIGQIAYGPVAGPVGQRVVRLHMGGALVHENSSRADAAFNTQLPFFAGQLLNAGDTIYIETYQSQGAATALAVNAGENHIDIHLTV